MLQKIVVFKINEQLYGVNIDDVQSIEHVSSFTRIPQVERYFKGIINLRGEIVPIIDLKLKLNLGESKISDNTKAIITKIDGAFVGFLVDEATDVLDIQFDQLEKSTELTASNDYIIEGVVKLEKTLILLIQFKKILQEQDFKIIHELTKSKK